MKRAFTAPLVLCVLAATVVAGLPGTAEATPLTLVFGNLGSSGTAALSSSSFATVPAEGRLAVGFTIGGSSNVVLDSVELGLWFAEPLTAGVALMTSAGSGTSAQPSGSIIATSGGPFASPLPVTLVSFPFLPRPSLSPGSYWLVFGSNDGETNWVFSNSGATPGPQNSSNWTALSPVTKSSTSPYTTWTASGDSAVSLNVYVLESVPEIDPSGIGSAMAFVAGATGLLERRRRNRMG